MTKTEMALVIKNPPANAGDIRDVGLIPGSGRSLEGGHSNPLQYSCLENPMDRGAWWATVHGVTKGRTGLKQLSTHTRTVARRAPLSMGLSRQEYWSGLLCPPPGDHVHQGIEPESLISPALAGGFVTTSATWEAPYAFQTP